jgi:hypothetical protein
MFFHAGVEFIIIIISLVVLNGHRPSLIKHEERASNYHEAQCGLLGANDY